MTKKKCSLFLMFISVLLCLEKKEYPIPNVKEDIYVYDNGDILSDDTEKEINSLLTKLESGTGAEMVVITITDLNGLTIEEYANQLFNSLGIGKKEEDNGALLLVSRDDARVRLEIGIGFEDVLTDSTCGVVLDKYFVPFINSDDYDTAVKSTSQETCRLIAQTYEISTDKNSRKTSILHRKMSLEDRSKVFGAGFSGGGGASRLKERS